MTSAGFVVLTLLTGTELVGELVGLTGTRLFGGNGRRSGKE